MLDIETSDSALNSYCKYHHLNQELSNNILDYALSQLQAVSHRIWAVLPAAQPPAPLAPPSPPSLRPHHLSAVYLPTACFSCAPLPIVTTATAVSAPITTLLREVSLLTISYCFSMIKRLCEIRGLRRQLQRPRRPTGAGLQRATNTYKAYGRLPGLLRDIELTESYGGATRPTALYEAHGDL